MLQLNCGRTTFFSSSHLRGISVGILRNSSKSPTCTASPRGKPLVIGKASPTIFSETTRNQHVTNHLVAIPWLSARHRQRPFRKQLAISMLPITSWQSPGYRQGIANGLFRNNSQSTRYQAPRGNHPPASQSAKSYRPCFATRASACIFRQCPSAETEKYRSINQPIFFVFNRFRLFVPIYGRS